MHTSFVKEKDATSSLKCLSGRSPELALSRSREGTLYLAGQSMAFAVITFICFLLLTYSFAGEDPSEPDSTSLLGARAGPGLRTPPQW